MRAVRWRSAASPSWCPWRACCSSRSPSSVSFAYSGVATVLTSVFAALVILPTALGRLDHRVARKDAATRPANGWWHSTALRMMRRPLLWGIPALVVLLGLAAPTMNLTFGVPDERVLPASASSRVVQQDIRDNFAGEEMDALQVLRPGQPGTEANQASIDATAAALSRIADVQQVDALTGSYAEGRKISAANATSSRFGFPRRDDAGNRSMGADAGRVRPAPRLPVETPGP